MNTRFNNYESYNELIAETCIHGDLNHQGCTTIAQCDRMLHHR